MPSQSVLTSCCPDVTVEVAHTTIVDSLFERIVMDIVGPLPRSHIGNLFVLVVCDYATRWPEAVALKSINAGHVAEELMVLFSRVGYPRKS